MIRVLYNHYLDRRSKIRQAELDTCLSNLTNNPAIDQVIILLDPHTPLPDFIPFDKVIFKQMDYRPLFKDFFHLADLFSVACDINIIINSDCYLEEESVRQIAKHIKPRTAYAITRTDIWEDGTRELFECVGSQDCWIVQGRPNMNMQMDYSMGIPACDHRIAAELSIRGGYKVKNPARSIQLLHLHNSKVRHYGGVIQVDPPYHGVLLETFEDIELDLTTPG